MDFRFNVGAHGENFVDEIEMAFPCHQVEGGIAILRWEGGERRRKVGGSIKR
jgi:hypothetical protein